MRASCAVVLVVDRLHAGMLGPYGNTWIETPALNRLAAESLVLDSMIIDSPDLQSLTMSYWTGQHALRQLAGASSAALLPAVLKQAGVDCVLITDEPQLSSSSAADEFSEVITVDLPAEAVAAETIEETHLAGFFSTVADWLEHRAAAEQGRPFLLWVHTRGLAAPWDAPYDFRSRYADEDDPAPPEIVQPPDYLLPEDSDPDEVLGISHAYAGQVTLLDECIGALVEGLQDSPLARDLLLMLVSPRGFPLGEHTRIGPCDEVLHSELLHVPCMLRTPDGRGAAARSHALVQPMDIYPTLLDWFAGTSAAPEASVEPAALSAAATAGQSLWPLVDGHEQLRDRVCTIGHGHERALRTPSWTLRIAPAKPVGVSIPIGDASSLANIRAQLYVKPDDRFEVNDVSDRCPDIVEGLIAALRDTEAAVSADAAPLAPLAEPLHDGIE